MRIARGGRLFCAQSQFGAFFLNQMIFFRAKSCILRIFLKLIFIKA